MSYFLFSGVLKQGEEAELSGEEARHVLLSRRMKRGDVFELQDCSGLRYSVEIKNVKKNGLVVLVGGLISVPAGSLFPVTVCVAVISEKSLDFVFQKLTELGVAEVVLFNSSNVATRLTREKFFFKKERWEKIFWEAAKQSGRPNIPNIIFFENFSEFSSSAARYGRLVVLDAEGGKFEPGSRPTGSLAFVVGPEGGLTESEKDSLRGMSGCDFVSLCSYTVRSETAAVAAAVLASVLS